MKRFVFIVAVVVGFLVNLHAVANVGFGLDAFNRAVSASTQRTVVFSPFSFEIDSVIFSEAVDTLSRAKLSETMGVLNGLEPTYQPIHETLTSPGNSNLFIRDARGFCLFDARTASPSYRQWLQKTFSAEVFDSSCRIGAECWFRARLDGDMENFTLSEDISPASFYSYYDLTSMQFFWKVPFPTNKTCDIKFRIDSSVETSLPAICDVRVADILKQKNYSALRLVMSDNVYFYALLPSVLTDVRDLRNELVSTKIHDFIGSFNSISESNVSRGRVSVVIPKMDITSETDLKLPFDYFRFPTQGMERMGKNIKPKYLRQRIRFRLDENGHDVRCNANETRDLSNVDSQFVLNKPFLFFVYHEPTGTILVVGMFTGCNDRGGGLKY